MLAHALGVRLFHPTLGIVITEPDVDSFLDEEGFRKIGTALLSRITAADEPTPAADPAALADETEQALHSRGQDQRPPNTTQEDKSNPKRQISDSDLEAYFRAIKDKGDPIPAQDASVRKIAAQYPANRVTRSPVRAAHIKVFGHLPTGKRSQSA